MDVRSSWRTLRPGGRERRRRRRRAVDRAAGGAPVPGTNPIGWLVWHLTRVQDGHVSELLGGDEVWANGPWPADSASTPTREHRLRAHAEQVAQGAPTSADALTGYYDAVRARTTQFLADIEPEAWTASSTPGGTRRSPSACAWCRSPTTASSTSVRPRTCAGCSSAGDARRSRRTCRPRGDAGRRHRGGERRRTSRGRHRRRAAHRVDDRPRWVWWSAPSVARCSTRGDRPGLRPRRVHVCSTADGGPTRRSSGRWPTSSTRTRCRAPATGPLRPGPDAAELAEPIGADGHLRPQWPAGEWSSSADAPRRGPSWRCRWRAPSGPAGGAGRRSPQVAATARAESAAEVLCVELGPTGCRSIAPRPKR